ncbi:hypothetical protein D3C72_1283990 [compost metagenome]
MAGQNADDIMLEQQFVQNLGIVKGERFPLRIGTVEIKRRRMVHHQQLRQFGVVFEFILKPFDLPGLESPADLAGNAGVHDDDVDAGNDFGMIIGLIQILMATEHHRIKTIATIVIAEREEHRHIQFGLRHQALEFFIAAGIAPIGQIAADDDELRRRHERLDLRERRGKRGRGLGIKIIILHLRIANMQIGQMDEIHPFGHGILLLSRAENPTRNGLSRPFMIVRTDLTMCW